MQTKPKREPKAQQPSRILVRNALPTDIEAIVALSARVYGDEWCYRPSMISGQITAFTEGQFVLIYDDKVVGYCATFIIEESIGLGPHTWRAITGSGYASRHDPKGDWLYGMEIFVDPEYRGLRIGRRLYDQRKILCRALGLKGIVFAGRIPGFAKRQKQYGSALEYVKAVAESRIRDATLSFQLRNSFELVGVLPDYLPSDVESAGNAAHLIWRNPAYADNSSIRKTNSQNTLFKRNVRVATVQYGQRRVKHFEEFAAQVEFFVDVAADYRADFVLFPEFFTLQLLSIANEPLAPADAIGTLTQYTAELKSLLSRLAMRYNINIVGGSHPTKMADGDIHNVCYVCLRDGSIHAREKIHITPSERRWWGIKGGESADVIHTDCGPIGITICYDSEFPELARHLIDQGAMILFVPFCTDVREGYLRVRYSCAARAIENQCYMVLSGNVGNIPGVHNFDIQYAQSCILTPCDVPFARDGVAADTTANTEMIAFADLQIDKLIEARNDGSVLNLRDRRFDLYQSSWTHRDK